MNNRSRLWSLYVQAKQWKCRPSDLLAVREEFGAYEAYCLDNAVWTFGQYVESELDKVDHDNPKVQKKRRAATLTAILENDPAKKYADPAKMSK